MKKCTFIFFICLLSACFTNAQNSKIEELISSLKRDTIIFKPKKEFIIKAALYYEKNEDFVNAYSLWLSYVENPENVDRRRENNPYNLALFKVALYKYEGRGTPKDIDGAIKYAEKARLNGDISVLSILYLCYEEEDDARNSFLISKEIYEKEGMPLMLADHYLYGKGCEQDLPKVYNMLTGAVYGNLKFKLADGSSVEYGKEIQPVCQLYIGIANYFDKTKPGHYEEGIKWLKLAMESEEASDKTKGEAACLLSRCYRFGRGVRQDITTANELEKKAKNLLSEEGYNNFSKHFQASY